jgi:uncharacterized protein YjdB
LQFFASKARPGASRSVVRLVAAVLMAACSTDSLGPGAASVESVVVAPTTATVAVGANLTLNAEVRDADGTVLASQRVSWASEDPSIAEVSQSGVVTGLRSARS